MSPANGKDEQQALSRKPRARPASTAFTAPENRLLSQLYLANKEQYHAKTRVAVGAKSGQTSQERYATEFAAELTKLGFTRRTSTQVKQRIADIRKLAHKLVTREAGTDKKLVVEPWLQNVIVALGQEGQEKEGGGPNWEGETRSSLEKQKEDGEVDKMSAMAQNVLDGHLRTHGEQQGEPITKRRRSARNSARNMASHEKVKLPAEADKEEVAEIVATESLAALQKRLAMAQLRVAVKTERLLDLKIKKMQVEMAASPRRASFAFSAESPDEEEPADKGWKTENGVTAQIQEKNTADLIECLLTLKGAQP